MTLKVNLWPSMVMTRLNFRKFQIWKISGKSNELWVNFDLTLSMTFKVIRWSTFEILCRWFPLLGGKYKNILLHVPDYASLKNEHRFSFFEKPGFAQLFPKSVLKTLEFLKTRPPAKNEKKLKFLLDAYQIWPRIVKDRNFCYFCEILTIKGSFR